MNMAAEWGEASRAWAIGWVPADLRAEHGERVRFLSSVFSAACISGCNTELLGNAGASKASSAQSGSDEQGGNLARNSRVGKNPRLHTTSLPRRQQGRSASSSQRRFLLGCAVPLLQRRRLPSHRPARRRAGRAHARPPTHLAPPPRAGCGTSSHSTHKSLQSLHFLRAGHVYRSCTCPARLCCAVTC